MELDRFLGGVISVHRTLGTRPQGITPGVSDFDVRHSQAEHHQCNANQRLLAPEIGCAPSGVHVVAPVPEISPAGQAVQGGVPVVLNEFGEHRPYRHGAERHQNGGAGVCRDRGGGIHQLGLGEFRSN